MPSNRRTLRFLPCLALLLGGCDESESEEFTFDDQTSGFLDPMDGDASTDAGESTSGEPGSTTGNPEPVADELRGVLSFSLYPPDAQSPTASLGVAGAWRDIEQPLEGVDDFYSIWGLSLVLPAPPTTSDTLEHNGLLSGFDWGNPYDWQLAGTAMKLQTEEHSALACLLYLGGSPTVEIGDNTYPNYPVYGATFSALQPDECHPDPAAWSPDTSYDLVLYGGEQFPDNILAGRVHTPADFELAEPDVSVFQAALETNEPLTIRWSGDGNPEDRIVIRMIDMFNRTFTILADDDGEYTIAADDLQVLDEGPVILIVARERLETFTFSHGQITVTTRLERRGYLNLTAALDQP